MNRVISASLAAFLLFILASCTAGGGSSSSGGTSAEVSSSHVSSQSSIPSVQSQSDLKPLTEFTKGNNLPKSSVIGKSFIKGSLYKGPSVNYRKADGKATLGVWWWDITYLVNSKEGVSVDQILDCLLASNVTEIYLSTSAMLPWSEQQAQGGTVDEGMVSEADVRGFVAKCGKLGIRVAALGGSPNWVVESDMGMGLYNFLDRVNEYQVNADNNEKFYGVHLDVEPHTFDDFQTNRSKYCALLAALTANASEYAKKMNLLLEWDIFSYFDEKDKVFDPRSGKEVTMLDIMFTYCDTVGVMTYYNNGLAQFERGELEVEYAKKYNKKVVLSSETIRISPSSVSYYLPGRDVLITESEVLRKKLEETGVEKYGFAVHHAVSFYALMNREK